MADMFDQAFAPDERVRPPNPPNCLLREPTLNRYHVGSAGKIGGEFAVFIDGVCGAVSGAIANWMPMTVVTIKPGLLNANIGVLTPGDVVGPPLTPLILASAPMKTPMEAAYSTAVATAIGTGWAAWHALLMGTVMFPPTFAASPSPFHPPTPNLPAPLIMLSSGGEAMLSPATLKSAMLGLCGDPKALHAADLFDAISSAFDTAFLQFKGATMLQNVLGSGPVPTMMTPVPVPGPVVAGFAMGVSCLA
jgi:hypothetical protein